MNDLVAHQDGVIAMSQAMGYMSAKAIRHRLTSGRWQQMHRSVFVTHNGQITIKQQRWAAVLAATGGVEGAAVAVGGLTALNLRGYETETVHLLVSVARRPRSVPSYALVHQTRSLEEGEIIHAGRPPRTRPARSLVDAAQWAHTDTEARAIIAAAFQQRLVREGDVRRVLDRLTRARRRRLINQTVVDAVAGAHSLAEIDFVDLCRRNGLPEPTRQVVRQDSTGRRRYLDAVFQEWQVHVEVDGSQHLEVRQAWADMRRQNDLWIAGERVLRFPAWTIRSHPESVVAQVRAALHAAGWAGS